jgi:hypothetical protein
MQQIQGHTRCPWKPPLGDYLLCIIPAATRATGKQTSINKYTCEDGHFNGHGDAPVRNCAHHPMEEVQSFTRSHWTPPLGKYYVQYYKTGYGYNGFFYAFIVKTIGKGHGLMLRPLFSLGVLHIKQNRRA